MHVLALSTRWKKTSKRKTRPVALKKNQTRTGRKSKFARKHKNFAEIIIGLKFVFTQNFHFELGLHLECAQCGPAFVVRKFGRLPRCLYSNRKRALIF